MSFYLHLEKPTDDTLSPRIGGGALIGGIIDWPSSPSGQPLTLIASIPNSFLSKHTGINIPADLYTSIFSYYSETDYFLDQITYHGNPDELSWINQGGTKVIQHKAGESIQQGSSIPQHLLRIGEHIPENENCESRIGGSPSLLQNEKLETNNMKFALQFRSSDFPEKFNDIFGVLDDLGYLFLNEDTSHPERDGLFFVQTT
jgi:hypothetical protein